MNEIVREFLLETQENLAQLDLDFIKLEKEPTERETLARVFRTLHTVKGTAGFLGLAKLQAVAHAAENLLSRLRAGELTFNPVFASALLAAVDAIRRMLAFVEKTENDGDEDYSAQIQTLDRLRSGEVGPVPASVPKQEPPAVQPVPPAAPFAAANEETLVTFQAKEIVPLGETPFTPTRSASEGPPAPPAAPAPTSPEPPSPEAVEPRGPSIADSSLRVDVGLLDKLMTLVGELVLARNQIMQFSASQEDAGFLNTVQRLNMLTTELQAGVMKTRMQPIGNIWTKFPRLVRDLAIACGKQVRLDMEGRETELDKTIIEAIRDPLTHLVRNAIDHGIETPASRLSRSKPAEGRLTLHAFHEGGKVIIEISDDGGGIDPQRVRDKAVAAKIVTPEQAARMSERDLLNLIFLPGFSTTDRVTQFSGRGVGMDVVRTNIERIGGTVDVKSQLGRGTTVKMKIPLTLAIIPALTITSGGDRYAIPQVSLLELVRLEGEQAVKGIEQIHGAPVYRLRGNLLPLVYLNEQLQVGKYQSKAQHQPEAQARVDSDRSRGSARPIHQPEAQARDNGELNIVVLQADDRHFGLIVDDIHDTEEIVVKPLQKQLKGINAFAGATIMGDGTVALILDVLGLAQRANVVSASRERSLNEKPPAAEKAADRHTVLLCTTPDGGRIGISLSLVARLEEFPRSALERTGSKDVVQYRDQILPLIHVGRALRRQENGRLRKRRSRRRPKRSAAEKSNANETVQVVVYATDQGRVGLVVGNIVDIVEESIESRSRASRPGVLYTAVIQGRVTEFLDVEGIIRSADPEFFAPTSVSEN